MTTQFHAATFTATIYCGSRIGYSAEFVPLQTAKDWLQTYCDDMGYGLTFTPTEFIYTYGNEPGMIVGLINYPRLPRPDAETKIRALEIAENLRIIMQQIRVSIVFPDETITLIED